MVAERRRRRSETARQAYRQRLVNQKEKDAQQTKEKDAGRPEDRPEQQQPTPMTAAAVSDDPTPEAALQRIQARLDEYNINNNNDSSESPFWQSLAADLDLTLQPSKLQGRKQLLRRLLADVWDLRGRCVPVASDNHPGSDDNKTPGICHPELHFRPGGLLSGENSGGATTTAGQGRRSLVA